MRIAVSGTTVKGLTSVWQQAGQRGERRLVQRVTALLLLADQQPVAVVAARLGLGVSTVYRWLSTCLRGHLASLVYRTPPGRPATLTKTQQQRRHALVLAGPEAAGFATGGWNSAVLQALIQREFGVRDSVPSVTE